MLGSRAQQRSPPPQVRARITEGGVLRNDVVVQLLGWHTPTGACFGEQELGEASVAALEREFGAVQRAEHTPCSTISRLAPYPYVLVMERAERSLHDACAKERIAGLHVVEIQHVVRSIATCLGALHEHGVCHGDCKQRNVLRLDGRWVLCDMDAAARAGECIGEKTSTAYCPPELAHRRFAELQTDMTGREPYSQPLTEPEHDIAMSTQLQVARPSFDVWSLGVVMFELCAGHTLFRQDTCNDALVEATDRTRLCTWHTIDEQQLSMVRSTLYSPRFPKACSYAPRRLALTV